MKLRNLLPITFAGMVTLLLTFAPMAAAEDKANPASDAAVAQENLAYALGVQAFIWGYPMVKLQGARDMMTTYFGYRFLHLELKDEGEGVTLDANVQGPLLGIGFTF
jgi:hypothetical protein